jgi:hypothetical protein
MKAGNGKGRFGEAGVGLACAEAPEIVRNCRSREGEATRARQKMSRAKGLVTPGPR